MTVSFLTAPPHQGQEQVENNAVEVEENMDPPKERDIQVEYPKLGESPNTGKAYDFRKMSGYLSNLIWGMLLL